MNYADLSLTTQYFNNPTLCEITKENYTDIGFLQQDPKVPAPSVTAGDG